ncbi:MAG: methylmalonyl-CoA mutase family protein, partial [Gaiellaceae bacterium]
AEIEEAAYRYTRELESGERVLVGVNRFEESEDGSESIELHRLEPEVEQRQKERTARVRAGRDGAAASTTMEELRRVARSEANLLPPIRQALRSRCTVGEICGLLREEFGTFDAARQ